MSTPDIQPPQGYEILTPEFLQEHGAQDGMKFWSNDHWADDNAPDKPFEPAIDFRFQWCAPLGTMAMVSTPLPEVRCSCRYEGSVELHEHKPNCPCHPRNARVKVLPGWLSELKEKPEGLEWCEAPPEPTIWSSYQTEWEFPKSAFVNWGDNYAYSLPRYVYDAIEANYAEWNAVLSPVSNAPAKESQPPGAGQSDGLRCPRCLNPRQFADCTHPFHAGANPPLPTYRPLAPDEVPQVGDEVSVNWEDDWHPFDPGPAGAMAAGKYKDVKFRTTRSAPQPDDQEPKTCLVCGGPEPCSHKFEPAPASREWLAKAAARKDSLSQPALKTPCPHCGYENFPQHVLCASCNLAMKPAPVSGTPLTDAVAKTIGAMAMQLRDREMSPSRFSVEAQAELDKLGALESKLAVANAEIEELKARWNRLDIQHSEACRERDALRNALEDIHAKAVKITKLRHFPGGDCGADSIAEGIIDIIDETKGGAK